MSTPTSNDDTGQEKEPPWRTLPVILAAIALASVLSCGLGICGTVLAYSLLSKTSQNNQKVDLLSSQEDIAEQQIATLQNACDQYKMKNPDYPDSLRALTEKDANGRIYLKSADAIYDPWKKEYKYDKNGGRNNDKRPDIWTVSPAPESKEIGNWQTNSQKK